MFGFDALTTLELFILAVLWGSGIYRVAITLRQPWALWRASFTTAMILLPLATTIHFYRAEVSSVLQLPNTGGLLARGFFVLAGVCVVIYIDTLKDDSIAPRRLRRHLTIGGAAIVILVGTWIVAPIHSAELAGLSAYATHPAVAVHNLTFYAYLALVLGLVARFCAREVRESGPRGHREEGQPHPDRAGVRSGPARGFGVQRRHRRPGHHTDTGGNSRCRSADRSTYRPGCTGAHRCRASCPCSFYLFPWTITCSSGDGAVCGRSGLC